MAGQAKTSIITDSEQYKNTLLTYFCLAVHLKEKNKTLKETGAKQTGEGPEGGWGVGGWLGGGGYTNRNADKRYSKSWKKS